MPLTRDSSDVWAEILDKAERHRTSGEPIYTLVENVPNRIVKVEADKIWRQRLDCKVLNAIIAISIYDCSSGQN